jgi:hypothetical protein
MGEQTEQPPLDHRVLADDRGGHSLVQTPN